MNIILRCVQYVSGKRSVTIVLQLNSHRIMALAEVLTHVRIFVTLGPGLAFLLFLHEAIRVQRPDIVDKDNRIRSIETYELLDSYDFIIVGGGSAGVTINCHSIAFFSL